VPIDKNGAIASVSGLPGIPQITVGTGGAELSGKTDPGTETFGPTSGAWAFDYFGSDHVTPKAESTSPGVIEIQVYQTGILSGKWSATHFYVNDEAGGSATPQSPASGDTTGNIVWHI
jgi:hypothetical protein